MPQQRCHIMLWHTNDMLYYTKIQQRDAVRERLCIACRVGTPVPTCDDEACAHAGFKLSAPATVLVGTAQANITNHESSSTAFTYPNIPPGEYQITVQRKGLTSNTVPVTIVSAAAASTAQQGGPFSGTPKYSQTSIPINAVRPLPLTAVWPLPCL
jgi:hypothetical protein